MQVLLHWECVCRDLKPSSTQNVDASHSTFNDIAGNQHTYYQTVSGKWISVQSLIVPWLKGLVPQITTTVCMQRLPDRTHSYFSHQARAPSDASAIGIYASGSSSLKLDGNTFTITSSKGSARGMILEDQSKAEGKNNKFFITGDGGPT
jgi:hypothetical protein